MITLAAAMIVMIIGIPLALMAAWWGLALMAIGWDIAKEVVREEF